MKTLSSFNFVLTLATLALTVEARASTVFWNPPISGSGGSVVWAAGVNWGGTAPVDSLTADIAVFNSSGYNFQPDAGITSVAGLLVGSSSGAVTISGTQLSLGSTGINLVSNAGALTVSTPLTLGSDQTWTNNSSNTLTTGSVTNGLNTLSIAGSGATNLFGSVGSGSGGLVKIGSGTATLGAANTYTGGTTVKQGTLRLDFSATGAPSSNIINSGNALTLGGGALNVRGKASTTNSQTFGGTNLSIGASSGSISVIGVSNPVLLSLGTITRNIGGTLNLTQPTLGAIGATNGFTTANTDTNGILGGYATIATSATVSDWARNNGTNIVALTTYTDSSTAGTIAANYANNNVNVDANQTLAGAITPNTLRFNSTGARTLTLTGTNSILSGGVLVNGAVGGNLSLITGGTLTGSAGGDLVIIQNNTSGVLQISSLIADNGSATSLTKSGAGQLTIATSNNTFTGKIYLNAGTLSASTDLRLGAVPGAVVADKITFNGGTLQINSSFNLNSNRGITLLENGGRIDTLNSGISSTYAGIIAGVGSFAKISSGVLTLSGSNTFSGETSVTGGTLTLSNQNALQNSTVSTGGTGLVFSSTVGAHAFTLGGLSGSANLVLQDNAGSPNAVALTVGNNNGSPTVYTGILSGAGSLIKTGTGTQILSGANTYGGTTTIGNGTLLINGTQTSATGSIIVNTGGTLGGSGTIGGDVTVNSGATLAPGNSPGNLTIANNTTIENGGTLSIEINGATPGSEYDRITMTGASSVFSLSGTNNLALTLGYGPADSSLFFLVDNQSSSAISGVFEQLNGVTTALGQNSVFMIGSQSFQISYAADTGSSAFLGGNDIALQAVPEPSAGLLFFAAGLTLFILRRQRR